jgi:hypothetical protein
MNHSNSFIDNWLHGTGSVADITRPVGVDKKASPYSESYPKTTGMYMSRPFTHPDHDLKQSCASILSTGEDKLPTQTPQENGETSQSVCITIESEENKSNENASKDITAGSSDLTSVLLKMSDSSDSVWDYQSPGSNQSTVNSMTPLIKSSCSDDDNGISNV